MLNYARYFVNLGKCVQLPWKKAGRAWSTRFRFSRKCLQVPSVRQNQSGEIISNFIRSGWNFSTRLGFLVLKSDDKMLTV